VQQVQLLQVNKSSSSTTPFCSAQEIALWYVFIHPTHWSQSSVDLGSSASPHCILQLEQIQVSEESTASLRLFDFFVLCFPLFEGCFLSLFLTLSSLPSRFNFLFFALFASLSLFLVSLTASCCLTNFSYDLLGIFFLQDLFQWTGSYDLWSLLSDFSFRFLLTWQWYRGDVNHRYSTLSKLILASHLALHHE